MKKFLVLVAVAVVICFGVALVSPEAFGILWSDMINAIPGMPEGDYRPDNTRPDNTK